MSRKPLLSDEEQSIMQSALKGFKKSNPSGSKNDFFTGLKAFNPEFRKYEDKQLDNQIIAQRRISNEKNWPEFSKSKAK